MAVTTKRHIAKNIVDNSYATNTDKIESFLRKLFM